MLAIFKGQEKVSDGTGQGEKLFLKDKIPMDKFSGFTKTESGLRILFKLK